MNFCHDCAGEGFVGEVEGSFGFGCCDWEVQGCGLRLRFRRFEAFESGVQMISGEVGMKLCGEGESVEAKNQAGLIYFVLHV